MFEPKDPLPPMGKQVLFHCSNANGMTTYHTHDVEGYEHYAKLVKDDPDVFRVSCPVTGDVLWDKTNVKTPDME